MAYTLTQLRVVRAFKSTLEDIEEKRSVQSYHSYHCLRKSLSHHGQTATSRPLYEETPPNIVIVAAMGGSCGMATKNPSQGVSRGGTGERNGSYCNMAMSFTTEGSSSVGSGRRLSNKSRSAENISLGTVDSHSCTSQAPMLITSTEEQTGAEGFPSLNNKEQSRTISYNSDLNLRKSFYDNETAI